mmetsp:Transcript_18723/g.38484  ORF Transcript_18723/g.38484 Transcript_18723/m.38484 type:complete len:334 (-) Transcript_18723:49-1050(-)
MLLAEYINPLQNHSQTQHGTSSSPLLSPSYTIIHRKHNIISVMRVSIQNFTHHNYQLLFATIIFTSCITSNSFTLFTQAFRTGVATLPMKVERLPRSEIFHRLGLATTSGTSGMKNQNYFLRNEHEVLCPITGTHQGILCSTNNPQLLTDEGMLTAENISNNADLISSVITAGSLAASVRNRGVNSDSSYYLPEMITLVESYLPVEDMVGSLSLDLDWHRDDGITGDDVDGSEGMNGDFMLYSCNTQMDYSNEPGRGSTATSDVYLMPAGASSSTYGGFSGSSSRGSSSNNNNFYGNKVWRFSIEFKVATINLNQIKSFTPQRPDVWLKDDYY